MAKLKKEFFDRPTVTVAKELLGKRIVFNDFSGIITETEAYIGQDDPACHASRGVTPRTEVMFGPAGVSYVYFIYGMYHCLNFVTEEEGMGAAVLIRGVLLDDGRNLNGPGKLCRELGITKEQNKIDITKAKNFYVEETGHKPKFVTTPRIGISKGKEKMWRFVVKD